MRIAHGAAVFGLGALLGMTAFAAGAVPITIYDPVAHANFTYDPDKVRGDATGTAVGGDAATQATLAPGGIQLVEPPLDKHRKVDPKFDRQEVAYDTKEEPGTVVIDTKDKFLYFVEDGGKAIRMGVGVGRQGFGWTGAVHVGDMQENPKWFPPPDMVGRQPELAKYVVDGMPGGPGNPLGVRAIYLYDDKGKDTLFRIHGTIEPWSIGLNVSSGCIRMVNENVTELYSLVKIGTKVVVM